MFHKKAQPSSARKIFGASWATDLGATERISGVGGAWVLRPCCLLTLGVVELDASLEAQERQLAHTNSYRALYSKTYLHFSEHFCRSF